MEIDNVYLLIAATIERARVDANTMHRLSDDHLLSRTCTVTEKDHPARDCAENLLDLVYQHQDDLLELCFEVTGIWLR